VDDNNINMLMDQDDCNMIDETANVSSNQLGRYSCVILFLYIIFHTWVIFNNYFSCLPKCINYMLNNILIDQY